MVLNNSNSNFLCEIDLPASKSIHNRVKILNALYNLKITVKNPSNSEDSVLLDALLNRDEREINCNNAGTVFRFLTAYYAVKSNGVVLTGAKRMHNRPIGGLVNALKHLGANISYTNQDGFPPLNISEGNLDGSSVTIDGQTSSQFISALMMIGPYLKNELTIHIEGEIASKPYIHLTKNLMISLGFSCNINGNEIRTKPYSVSNTIKSVTIEPDWSAVAFWFQIIAFSKDGKVFVKHLKTESLQGDSVLRDWAHCFGLKITESPQGILIEKKCLPELPNTIWDLSQYPDLAPSLIVMFSVFKMNATFIGLKTLKIKECDRILALQTELKKCQVNFIENNDEWILDASNFELQENTEFENYDDHRIAMAFACLSFIKPIKMAKPEVVNKSYPDFWKHLNLTQAYICTKQ